MSEQQLTNRTIHKEALALLAQGLVVELPAS